MFATARAAEQWFEENDPVGVAAAADQRSLTSLIEKLLTDFLKKGGYLPK